MRHNAPIISCGCFKAKGFYSCTPAINNAKKKLKWTRDHHVHPIRIRLQLTVSQWAYRLYNTLITFSARDDLDHLYSKSGHFSWAFWLLLSATMWRTKLIPLKLNEFMTILPMTPESSLISFLLIFLLGCMERDMHYYVVIDFYHLYERIMPNINLKP